MSPAEVGQAVGTVLVSGVAAWQAYRAKRNTRPVSNGFASGVQKSLEEITASVEEVRAQTKATHALMISHLNDHASADIRRRQRGW